MYTYQYPRAALTTDAIVFVKDSEEIFVLLIQRGREPFLNQWALPGGFIEMDETLEAACIRELHEETGLVVAQMQQFKVYDAIGRDPRHRTISAVHYVELKKKLPIKAGDDAANAQWFSIGNLPQLAFDHELILKEFFGLK